MKKLLLCVLTAFAFVGLTACESEKKLSAEEAQQTFKAAAENTEKELKKAANIKFSGKEKTTVSVKDVKLKSNTMAIMSVESAKLNTSETANFKASVNMADKMAKVSADADVTVDANVSSSTLKTLLEWENPKKFNYTAKGSAEAYYVEGKEDEKPTHIYAKYDATLNEALAKELDKESEKPQTSYKGAYNFVADSLFVFADMEDIVEEETEADTTTLFEFDFIKDWSIFSKKGNTITADCSNLNAFELGEDFEDAQAMLKTLGIELKVSKFAVTLNSNNAITKVDFEASTKGSADLSKAEIDYEDLSYMIEDYTGTYVPIDSITGTVTVDASMSFGVEIGYKAETIKVPDELAKVEETDISYIWGNQKRNSAEKQAYNVLAAGKNVLLEASATDDLFNGKVTKNGSVYSVTVKDLYEMGEIEKNPFTSTAADGGMTISLNADTYSWDCEISGKIDGYSLSFNGYSFVASK